jgi:F-type H+-transporting ATPase subunit epsilon
MHLSIITPDRTVFQGTCDSVTLPTIDGEITVLPHHVPLMGILKAGTLMIRAGKEEQLLAVSGGAIEVTGDAVRILADSADRAEELEEAAVEAAKKRAEDLMKDRRQDAEGFAEASAILDRELARLHVIRRRRKV